MLGMHGVDVCQNAHIVTPKHSSKLDSIGVEAHAIGARFVIAMPPLHPSEMDILSPFMNKP